MVRRVVITGIGVVTPLGIGREAMWRGLLAGRCAISPVEAFDTGRYKVHRGAEVKGFRPEEYVRGRSPSGLGRASQFAVAAARLALDDAGLAAGAWDRERAAVSLGTTSGEPRVVERFNDAHAAGEQDARGIELGTAYPSHVLAASVAEELE